ncbi:MAG: S-layer homology domain-containing protein [Lysinibacillus sp.]
MKKLLSFMLTAGLLAAPFSVQAAAAFKDVGTNHVLKPEIDYLVRQEVINGFGDGTFRPNQLMAKQHVAVMLVRALDLPTTNLENPGYKDVPATHLYYKEIAAGYTAGLFSKSDYFMPNSHISRGFMAKLLTAGFDLQYIPGDEEETAFKDVPSTHPFHSYIRNVASNNVAQGFGDGTFRSSQLITRGHFSAFLARAMSATTHNFLWDPESVYTYVNEQGEKIRITFDEAPGPTEQHWTATNLTTREEAPLIFSQNAHRYFGGIRNSDAAGAGFETPVTIRTVHVESAEGSLPSIAILDTDATLSVGGRTYTNLIVQREYTNGNYRYAYDHYLYFAEDIGLVAMKNAEGKMLYYLESIE